MTMVQFAKSANIQQAEVHACSRLGDANHLGIASHGNEEIRPNIIWFSLKRTKLLLGQNGIYAD